MAIYDLVYGSGYRCKTGKATVWTGNQRATYERSGLTTFLEPSGSNAYFTLLNNRFIHVPGPINNESAGPLQDLFTDSNGVAIASHTMDEGPGWTLLQGTGTIQSNKLESGTSGTELFISAISGYADCSASADFTLPGSGQFTVGVAMRVASVSSAIVAAFTNDGDDTYLTIVAMGGG